MEYEWVQKSYPSIYDSCYEIVANAMAAESVYFGKKEEFSEMQAYDKTKELFKDCYSEFLFRCIFYLIFQLNL